MTAKIKLSDILKNIDAAQDAVITGITADSREVKPGYIFAALPGIVTDGHKYIPQAEKAGAIAILSLPGASSTVPILVDREPRLKLAELAALLYPGQPECIAGITGTNGKTSIARFSQQLWQLLGVKAGSLGTLGAVAPGYEYTLRHTTPDPVEIHQILSTMTTLETTHLAMEVSSHGLAQYRADGVRFSVAAFTNLTQDHLDYHADFDAYLNAKLRLFTALLPQGGTAVVNADGAFCEAVIAASTQSGRKIYSVGRNGADIKLLDSTPTASGLTMKVRVGTREWVLSLPLFGSFQAENALVAAGVVICSGYPPDIVLPLLEKLEGAPGRMQPVAMRHFEGGGNAGIYVDYAHTPDAIKTALQAIRPHATGKVHIIMGAGGDRDKTKRPLMGQAALANADHIIVTDDNPRSENPAIIRSEILAACPGALEIADREAAIKAGIAALHSGDVLLIAGKGHELGQTIGTLTIPFDDADIARTAVRLIGQK